MARRTTLVAIAAVFAALLPASAQAATAPTDFAANTTGASGVPVMMTWTTALDVGSERVWRVTGTCGTIPAATPTQVATPTPPLGGGSNNATDSPPDGTWCYYVEVNDAVPTTPAYSNGDSVVVDTAPPPDTTPPDADAPDVDFTGAPNFARGTVDVTLDSSDAQSPPTTNSLRLGTATCDASTPAIDTSWDTTPLGDGTYRLCNVATDAVGNVGVSAAVVVVVDNTNPVGQGILTPVAGATISGTQQAPVSLTVDAQDATATIRNVQWRWQGATGGTHNIGGAQGNANNGYQRNWNTATGNGHPPDGPVTISAVVTDDAGNATIFTAAAIVDNTAPDAKAVVTAPPAVAGSPTLTWTPAHDAIGINHYDVLRGTTVINAVPIMNVPGAASYSFNDKNAPDQATSAYIVRAYDGAGHFLDSDPVSILVDSTSQTAPKSVAAATPTRSAPVLNWQAPTTFAVADYDIYRDGVMIATTTGPATTFTDATATEGTHDYAVLARDAASHPGVLSSSFKVVLDTTAPASGGAANAQVQADGQVLLAWPAATDALSGVASYSVRRASGGVPPVTPDGGTSVCTPTAPGCADAAASGTWSYGVFARDAAGNVALVGTLANVVVVDRLAPLAPTKLKVTRPRSKTPSTTISLTLHWVKPTAADLAHVVVVLNLKHAPTGPADGTAVYKGLGTSAKLKLRAGQTGYIAIYSYDTTGNVSPKPARTFITLAALLPLRPLNNSTVHTSTPMLSWKALKGTIYYNVQLFHKGKKLFVRWPEKASYRIPKGKIKPGTYVWYVWPAVKGKDGKLTFGSLIGRATFVYKK